VEYVGWRHKKMELLKLAGIPTPRIYMSPQGVDGPVIVKLFGAKGGRGVLPGAEQGGAGGGGTPRRPPQVCHYGFRQTQYLISTLGEQNCYKPTCTMRT